MQILIFVFAFLTAIAVMTQAQVDRYRDVRVVRKAYLQVMRFKEESLRNDEQQKLYDSNTTSRGESGGSDELDEDDDGGEESVGKTENKRTVLNPKVNVYSFVDSRVGDADPAFQRSYQIIQRLIGITYGAHPFYQEFQERYPDLENSLLQAVIEAGRLVEKKPKKAKHLASLELADPELQLLWYRLLKGNAMGDCNERYPPLTCFVDLRQVSKLGISVYKAPSPLLLAIFQDQGLVERVASERMRLWEDVKRGAMDLEIATDAFESAFGRGRYLPQDGGFDFRVNTSEPPP